MGETMPEPVSVDTRPFAGLRVIEFGTVIAGPFAGSLMADLGAEVIKVEQPGIGDVLRSMGHQKDGVALWWGVSGRDKKCVTLNVKDEAGRAIFRSLVEKADVLIENNRPGVLTRLGLDWAALHELNPQLVMLSISGFGQTGPEAHRPGFGKVAEGMSGLVHLTGDPEEPPLFVGFSLADTCAGLFGVMGLAMALYERDINGGGGALVDVALFEPLLRMMEYQFVAALDAGAPPMRDGRNNPYGWGRNSSDVRFQSLRSSDGRWFFVRVCDDAEAALRTIIKIEDGTNAHGALARWAGSMRSEDLRLQLLAAGVEMTPIFDGLSLAADPYMRARGDVVDVSNAAAGAFCVPGPIEPVARSGGRHEPFHFRELGEDNAAVFGDLLGIGDSERSQLQFDGTI
jgi:crotonobetainyl-CoA:carnitine CoA-transferase CaiB-like acyl-CoA transferase